MRDWKDAVEEHRETLEKLAGDDLPISEDACKLLAKADREGQ